MAGPEQYAPECPETPLTAAIAQLLIAKEIARRGVQQYRQ